MVEELNESHEAFLKETEVEITSFNKPQNRNKAKNEQAEDLENLEEYQKQLFEASRNFSLSRNASESSLILSFLN